jgi:cob(I)alamin adenosyltransferase
MIINEKGLLRVYTGNGQGQTTTAMGMAVKALSEGKSVYVGQFIKNQPDEESWLGHQYDSLHIEQLGFGGFEDRAPNEDDRAAALAGLDRCKMLMSSGMYDMIVMDELCVAIHYGLLTSEQVMEMLSQRPAHTEVIITGADAPQWLIDAADSVTEMHEIKHTANDMEAMLCDAINQ